MDEAAFQRAYHEYGTLDRAEAEREAQAVTLSDGSHPAVVALPFGDQIHYCLMLPQAAALLRGLFPALPKEPTA